MALLKHSLRNIFPGRRGAVESGLLSGQTYAQRVLSLGPIAYWPLWEADPQVNCNLFNVNMETGDLLQFDSLTDPDADLSATAAAAMGGTATGMSVIIDDQDPCYGRKLQAPPASNEFRVRVYIDPNGLAMAGGDSFVILAAHLSGAPWDHILLRLQYDGVNYEIGAEFYDDSGYGAFGGPVNISDAPHYVEVHVERETDAVSGDGRIRWWLDGVLRNTWATDNFATFALLDHFRVGAVQSVDAGTTGTFYLDELCANDTGVEIGPVPAMPVAECLVNPLQDGAYTGVQLANALGPDGVNYAPYFDGVNDFVDIYSATLLAAFDGAEGSLLVWCKVFNVGVWTDGSARYATEFRVDANNHLDMQKAGANNRIRNEYEANNILESENFNGLATVDWIHLAITWSISAGVDGQVSYYLNGVPIATDTALGVWVGALDMNRTLIGATSQVPASPWHGWLAHCPVFDRPLTPAEVLLVSTI